MGLKFWGIINLFNFLRDKPDNVNDLFFIVFFYFNLIDCHLIINDLLIYKGKIEALH